MSKFKNLSKKSRIILIISLVMVVCLMIALGTYLFIVSKILSKVDEPDLNIYSPDGRYELVVREFACLGCTGAEIYIREPGQDKWYNSGKEKRIGNASGDNYYMPFADGAYYVEWESDKVTIYYYRSVPIENKNDRSTWRGMVTYDLNKD